MKDSDYSDCINLELVEGYLHLKNSRSLSFHLTDDLLLIVIKLIFYKKI